MGEVQVISTTLVTPSNNHHNSHNLPISRIELNPWDLQLLLAEGIQKGLFFSKPSQSQLQTLKQHFSTQNLIQHLKLSFSHTLCFFPLLAGRFSTSKNDDNTTSFSIDVNNAGVEFTHAIANGVSIAQLLDPATYIPQIIKSFFPMNGVLNYEGLYKPLFGVQITELEDGIFIGCTMNHSVGDGVAFWHFFNSWSEISRGFSSISKSPIFSRWFPDDFTNFSSLHISLPEKQSQQKPNPPPIMQEKLFHFTKQNIAKLKSKANLENTSKTTTISSFQALVSHLWRSVTRWQNQDLYEEVFKNLAGDCSPRPRLVSLENTNQEQEVSIKLPVNARGRIQPFLPDGYFGNAFLFSTLKTTAKSLLENPLSYASLEINKVIASNTSESMKKGYIDMLNKKRIVGLGGLVEEGSGLLMITSSARHSVYTVDFGWGEALGVRSGGGNKRFGKVTVFPGREEGSVDFEVCLSLETLIALENDAEFMEVI